MGVLAKVDSLGIDGAMEDALKTVKRADEEPFCEDLRKRVEDLCEALFQAIGLQTSVLRYHASGSERGCVLDFLRYPLNNRWWLEDEFAKIRALESEKERLNRLEEIRRWEHPGPGCFYDDVGNIANSPHVVRGEGWNTDPLLVRNPNPGYWWWDSGFSRKRLSWQVSMDWPIAVRYERVDPNAGYVVRITGYGEALTRINGELVKPALYGRGIGEIKEFPVPRDAVRSGQIVVTWDRPEESELNWREQSRITEIWLLKKGDGAGR